MQHAVYKCPETDITMLTGVHYEDARFEEISRGPVRLHCPLCGTMHIVPLWRRRNSTRQALPQLAQSSQ